jgi:hypothetical protein
VPDLSFSIGAQPAFPIERNHSKATSDFTAQLIALKKDRGFDFGAYAKGKHSLFSGVNTLPRMNEAG